MLEELIGQVNYLKNCKNLDLESIKKLLEDIRSREIAYHELFFKLHDILKEHNIQCCLCKHFIQHEQRGASYCGKYLQTSCSNDFPECFES